MKLKQLSLFIENKAAHVLQPCQVLAKENINILTLSLADTEQFGILRLLVRDPEKAKEALEKAEHVVQVTEVVALEIEDRPGGLAELLEVIYSININIEYMYAFTFGRAGKAIMVFRFEDPDAAISALQTKGINAVNKLELYDRTDH